MRHMKFEWDETKNNLNKEKHKISFETASHVFYDPMYIEMYDFLREKAEFRARTPRSAEHAFAFGKAWSSTIIDFLMKINNL